MLGNNWRWHTVNPMQRFYLTSGIAMYTNYSITTPGYTWNIYSTFCLFHLYVYLFIYLFVCMLIFLLLFIHFLSSHLFIYLLLTWMMAFHTSALWMDFLEYNPQHRRLLNSPPPIATYIRQWIGSALVQLQACRLFGAKDYLNQCWIIVSWTLGNKRQWKSSQNTKTFHSQKASENDVCEMLAILSMKRFVDNLIYFTPQSERVQSWYTQNANIATIK